MSKKTILFVGDAGCPSGFERVTRNFLAAVLESYEPYVLGINYRGDPHDYPYRLWAAAPGGDFMGIGRLVWMCDMIMQEMGVPPDVIVLLNDGWNVPLYMQKLRQKEPNGEYLWPEYAGIPVVAIVAVDGKNFNGAWLDGIDHAIFWTQFALDEAREGGFVGSASVIPLGVDLETFTPMDRCVARRSRGLGNIEDAFIVGNINRNQPRKRWDLTIKYFAEWVYKAMPRTLRDGENMAIKDAYLYLHVAPTGDAHVRIVELCQYYGIHTRLALRQPAEWYGDSDARMVATYNSFDVAISTTQGEGMGLTLLEAMACGVPVVAPRWSALGDWADGAAWLVPCSTTALGVGPPNVLGGIPDEAPFIAALDRLYHDPAARKHNAQAALECAQQECFRWAHGGRQFLQALDHATAPKIFAEAVKPPAVREHERVAMR